MKTSERAATASPFPTYTPARVFISQGDPEYPIGQNSPEAPVVEITIPVFNEEADLERSVDRLLSYLRTFPFKTAVTIADNASTDGTQSIGQKLANEHREVSYVRLEQKGRGRALKHVWSNSDAEVLAYMDVDLSTDLDGLLPLVAPLISGNSHLAIGTRLDRDSRVERGPKREVISRCYNLILKSTLAARFSDAQCGFKAIRADVANELLPHVQDTGWFFDTELLILAQRSGLRVHEVPVKWVDDPDSRVDIVKTAVTDLRGVARLLGNSLRGATPTHEIRQRLVADTQVRFASQVRRFMIIGLFSTLAYAAIYSLTRSQLGAHLANFVALLLTAAVNNALNRRYTFSIRGSHKLASDHVRGLIVFAIALGITGAAIAVLNFLVTNPSHSTELATLVLANLLATVIRFVALRSWVFSRGRVGPHDQPSSRLLSDPQRLRPGHLGAAVGAGHLNQDPMGR